MTIQSETFIPEVKAGSPLDLGATVVDGGVNFALFSGSAERVELCLFDPTGKVQIAKVDLPEYTNEIWHGFVPGLKAGQLYGYRVHGRHAPEEGLRFNGAKLLLDPYARQLQGELQWDAAVYGYDLNAGDDADLTLNETDSAPFMPKSVVSDFGPDPRAPIKPAVDWSKSIFYETHVRGATMLHPAVPENLRGTFDGFGHEALVSYIRSLGVTSVELMPIHAFLDDHHLVEKKMRNYWGYNSIGFFAPEQRYLGASGLASFRDMVRKLHDAGLEVILDVVYNHTAEGNERGATISFKGIDNAAYYRLMPDEPRYYINDTGTGNTVNTSHPRVLQMVLDSLRYWVETMEVDGFRFDLGTILGREPEGFDPRGGFFDAIGQDPVLSKVKLIGEPWDIGPGGYQVGGFPPGWSEWNDKYRDTMRAYWRGDDGMTRDMAARMLGSGDVYDHRGRRPSASINFLTAHDGFTLNDLVSFNDKHNEANGEDNKDGSDDNRSCNYGAEGPTDDAAINAIRAQQRRNFLATLLLSHGAPMLLAGDEFARSQMGNNNAYCQDSEIGWIHWGNPPAEASALAAFTRDLISLRHENEIFRRASWRDGCVTRWLNPGGGDQTEEHWDDAGANTIGLWLSNPDIQKGVTQTLILFNPFEGDVEFALPARQDKRNWRVRIDTAKSGQVETDWQVAAEKIKLRSRSLVVLI